MNNLKIFRIPFYLITLFMLSACSGPKLKSVTNLPSGAFIVNASGMAKKSYGPIYFLRYQGAVYAKSKGCTHFTGASVPVSRSGFQAAFRCSNSGWNVADIIAVGPNARQ